MAANAEATGVARDHRNNRFVALVRSYSPAARHACTDCFPAVKQQIICTLFRSRPARKYVRFEDAAVKLLLAFLALLGLFALGFPLLTAAVVATHPWLAVGALSGAIQVHDNRPLAT